MFHLYTGPLSVVCICWLVGCLGHFDFLCVFFVMVVTGDQVQGACLGHSPFRMASEGLMRLASLLCCVAAMFHVQVCVCMLAFECLSVCLSLSVCLAAYLLLLLRMGR